MLNQTNRFRATCFRCGSWVQPDAGLLYEPTTEILSTWKGYPPLANLRKHLLVQHRHCAVRFAGTNVHHVYAPSAREE